MATLLRYHPKRSHSETNKTRFGTHTHTYTHTNINSVYLVSGGGGGCAVILTIHVDGLNERRR